VLHWPGMAIGLGSLVFLLGVAARYIGLAALTLIPLVFVPFNVGAALMLTKRVKDAEDAPR
jgi:hypothetical protein